MRLQIKDSTILMKKPFRYINKSTNFLRGSQVMKFIERQKSKNNSPYALLRYNSCHPYKSLIFCESYLFIFIS